MSEVQNRGRIEISDEQVAKAMQIVQEGLDIRFKRHGQFSHFSKHESHGIIVEECREMEDAVRSKNHQEYWDEVLDVVVACIWGIASRIARDEQNGSIFVIDDDI